MNFKHLITASLAAALPLTASAASLVIPAAGAGPGANGSVWKSDVTLVNLSASPTAVSLAFHDGNGSSPLVSQTLPARATTSIEDIVASKFGRTSATGAIEIIAADTSKLVVGSRTFNESSAGRYGQDIPAIDTASLTGAGESILLGPPTVAEQRFNFGIYAVSNANVTWSLVRADGTVAATQDRSYTAGQQLQYNSGISSLFGAEAMDDDSVRAVFKSGTGITYGSVIENVSGDPSYMPGIIAIPETAITFHGVDRNEDGNVEYPDADHDLVVDQALDIVTSMFPNFFRIVASTPSGAKVHFELIDAGSDVTLVDDNGTVEWAPGSDRKGATATLKVKATAGSDSTILSIPVKFK
jgi:hypothetical protein